jgi:hypothetical protein
MKVIEEIDGPRRALWLLAGSPHGAAEAIKPRSPG